MIQDFYLQLTGVEIYSENEIRVKADMYDLSGKKVTSLSTIYFPRREGIYPGLGDQIRLTVNFGDPRAVQNVVSATKEST